MTKKQFVKYIVTALLLFTGSLRSYSHPMPNSLVLIDMHSNGVGLELQLPLVELKLAVGGQIDTNTDDWAEKSKTELKAYILKHLHPSGLNNEDWNVAITDLQVTPPAQGDQNQYQELTVHLWLQPASESDVRSFILDYDVIINQVVTHTALVSIRQDWEAGIYQDQPVQTGTIAMDVVNNIVPPFKVEAQKGSWFEGFKSMLVLGMRHIQEGTDHLLFLLVLLLPAPLLPGRRRWLNFGGVKYSLQSLLKVVTAFTIGHSITLLIGALELVKLPSQLIETLIAFSILVSAIHAIRPIFPKQGIFIAFGFGLIHGLAFANTLTGLKLSPGQMALSILGFNMGIEIMQLFIVLLIVPWLILMSRTSIYREFRVFGAVLGGIAALSWMIDRMTEQTNPLSAYIEKIILYDHWIILFIAALAIISTIFLGKPKVTETRIY
ncbi:HupE/UreJ family protein [Mangrovibacterium diazotrophicum]|nr:HupE/UreJ family protein [Mangrovibacterium diazotrophicum]